ncbi:MULTISPECIES: DUF4129 domain-containing protein [Microbacterium]|uniref:DUF4129 domain-containing protein n=1 Tax=Microbacterium TaxID=33882 RepID=UPI0011EB6CD3|nr:MULTISPECIES: DUF4129 domain-containing protein [Microbacterium]
MMRRFDEVFVPDGDEARRWAEEELSRAQYADAKPTWFDLFARDVMRFLGDLFSADNGANVGPTALIVVTVLIAAALVTALLVWGRPRRSRVVRRAHTALLGADDDRSATTLRADAERSARQGDWDTAVILRYRAIARGLLERDLIDPAPGATAQSIARSASAVFADEAEALRRAAASFDDVRYLRHAATSDDYRHLAATDDRLHARRLETVAA